MKIAVTGSSKLAKSIVEELGAHSWRIEDRIDTSRYDVFINNAHQGFDQVYLLEKWYEAWKDDPTKLIINISSRASQKNLSRGYMYSTQKAALDHYADMLTYVSDKQCRISTLNLGLLESDLSSVSYSEVVDMIKYIINLPQHLEIPRVFLQHSECYTSVQEKKSLKKTLDSRQLSLL